MGILIHIRTFCVLYDTAFYSFWHQQTATTISHCFMYLCSIEFPLKYEPPFYIYIKFTLNIRYTKVDSKQDS
jgi:hypothetical protein